MKQQLHAILLPCNCSFDSSICFLTLVDNCIVNSNVYSLREVSYKKNAENSTWIHVSVNCTYIPVEVVCHIIKQYENCVFTFQSRMKTKNWSAQDHIISNSN